MRVKYQIEPDLSSREFIAVLKSSGLAERRPIDAADVIEGMLQKASIIVTARLNGKIVGVSRAISDFSYCTYLSDLAVDIEQQKKGIGKELIRLTHAEAGLGSTLILLSAPNARNYYPHIGMESHDSCWVIRGIR